MSELDLWHLDQKINDRGFFVDVQLAVNAVAADAADKTELADRAYGLTYGEVESATKRAALLKHILEHYGVSLPDMQADTLERRLHDDSLPWEVKELIAVRLLASSTSASKYKRLLEARNADDRLRGTMQFCGANRTARWAGRIFQPHNLPRIDIEAAAEWHGKTKITDEEAAEYVAAGVDALRAGAVEMFFDKPTRVISAAIRGCIAAPKGRKLVVSDLSNIEGRKLVWLSGEEWKLQAFRDFDAGIGADLYKVAYARAFQMDPADVDKEQRQIGKVMELALGYEGGVGAFVTMAAVYGLDLDELARKAWPLIPEDVREEAAKFWRWSVEKKRTLGLDEKVFKVCDSLKRLWRRAHLATVQFWADLRGAMQAASAAPAGKEFTAGRLVVDKKQNWLRVRLPSGRYLSYPAARLDGEKLSYLGNCPYTRQWKRIGTYGGKAAENATQAGSRDVLADRMQPAEDAGYEIVLHVHDELVTECPDSPEFSAEGLSKILSTNPAWAPGLPLAAAGFETYRYRKG